MYRFLSIAFGSALLLIGAMISSASAVTVGNAAIDRSTADTATSPFIMALTDDVFSAGQITQWQTYIDSVFNGSTGTMGMLVLSPTSTAGNYTIKAVDIEDNLGVGLHTFTPSPIDVAAGDILGLYISTARVALDWAGNNSSGPIQYYLDVNMPVVGQLLTGMDGVSTRTYSLNATVVPVPPSLPLFAAGLGLLGVLMWRRKHLSA